MTKRHFIYLIPAVLLLLSACAQDDVPALQEARQLSFAITDGGYASATGADSGAPATRAVEKGYATEFTEDDACGLYVVRGMYKIFDNVKLTATTDASTGNLVWQPDAGTLIAGGLTGEQYFLYYPYQSDMTGKTAMPTGATMTDDEFFKPFIDGWQTGDDQSTYAQYTASDLMTATGTAATGTGNTLSLSFSMTHRMALAVIDMPKTVYKFTNERMTDYAVSSPVTYSTSFRPLNMGDDTYRHLVNPNSTTVPIIEGSYDGGSREFTVTPSGIAAGSYKTYKVDGATTETKEHDLQVGDFFLADGSLLSKEADATVVQAANVVGVVFQTDPDRIGAKEKEKLRGNVHGLVMSVKYAAKKEIWDFYDNRYEGLAKCETKADNYNDISGYGNCEHIRARRGGFDKFPAFKVADGYNTACPVPATTTGWYLPSSGQLWDILRNLGGCPALAEAGQQTSSEGGDFYWQDQGDVVAALNAWMQKIAAGGKDVFGSFFLWSSSEYSSGYARTWSVTNDTRVNGYFNNKDVTGDVRPVLAF